MIWVAFVNMLDGLLDDFEMGTSFWCCESLVRIQDDVGITCFNNLGNELGTNSGRAEDDFGEKSELCGMYLEHIFYKGQKMSETAQNSEPKLHKFRLEKIVTLKVGSAIIIK